MEKKITLPAKTKQKLLKIWGGTIFFLVIGLWFARMGLNTFRVERAFDNDVVTGFLIGIGFLGIAAIIIYGYLLQLFGKKITLIFTNDGLQINVNKKTSKISWSDIEKITFVNEHGLTIDNRVLDMISQSGPPAGSLSVFHLFKSKKDSTEFVGQMLAIHLKVATDFGIKTTQGWNNWGNVLLQKNTNGLPYFYVRLSNQTNSEVLTMKKNFRDWFGINIP